MKILLIPEPDHYRDWIGKTYFDILSYYKKYSKNKVTIIYTDEYRSCNENFIQKINPDIIIFFDTNRIRFAERFKYVYNMNIPIFISSLDLFYFNNCINCQYIIKSNGILHFGHSKKLLNSYKKNFPNKIIDSFKGRFINSSRFKDYKQKKIYDILIYGTRHFQNVIEKHIADQEYKQKWENYHKKILSNRYNFYPLRTRLENLLNKNSHKYKLRIIKQACIYDAPIANEDLSKLINQSWLTLSTCTRADIPMAKYFEIAGSYSGILGNIPTDYQDLFKENIIEVTEWMTDEEILSTIDKILEDKQKLQKMINRLGDIIHKEYNLEAGVKDMDQVIERCI